MKIKTQFYPSWRTFITCCMLFLCSLNVAIGQEDETECPYFNVSSTDQSGVIFSLLSTDINATISGVIANVTVEQTYFNGGDSTIDASYVFPMSTNAAIYGMEMQLEDRTIVAEIKRRDEAQTIFDTANDAGLTASLLEQERPNVFQMSLANINPGDSLTVRMVYTELLVPKEGVYQFVFPSIVGPRFTTEGEPWVNQASIDAVPLSETDLNINLKINAGMALSADCISHPANFNYQGTAAQTIVNTNPGDDFIVNYTLDGNQIETGMLLYEGPDENFFLSMIQPATPDIEFESPEREYIFILDVSGSMGGEPINIAKNMIINLLNDLNNDDRFNIIFFAGGSATLAENSLPVTSDNIDMAVDMINNLNAGGGTNLLPAMDLALNMEGTTGFSRTFVILTDGFVTVEKEAFDLIRENLGKANFFSFGIGNNVNRFIIEGIAYVGEGESFVVTDDTDPEEVAQTFKEYIERPVLTNIEAMFEGINVYDVEPLTIPDVFAERPIIIYGKYDNLTNGTVSIKGDYASGEISSSLSFADYTDNMDENIALQYLWARKKIRLMSDYGIASNETDTVSIEEEITLLGLQYNLVTEFTSFVAVDSNAVSTPGPGNGGDPNGNGGGTTVDVSESTEHIATKKEYIKILGTIVGEDEVLRLRLEDMEHFDSRDFFLQITNSNGQILLNHTLNDGESRDLVTIPVEELSRGIYFVSVVSGARILDTEKFIVN